MFPIAFHPSYIHPVPENHRFPMEKYRLLPEYLLKEGIVAHDWFFEPTLATVEELILVHDAQYVKDFINLRLDASATRKTGFVHNKELVERELYLVKGAIEGARKAIKSKVAFNIAGGTHHAYQAHGEGFCMLNDQAVAAGVLLKEQLAKNILFIDLDVHQGNGTADIFQNEERVFTFSMHGKNNYPFKKEQSSLDIALEDNISDVEYLQLLNTHLQQIMNTFQPDFIFYQSGVDILESDKLGKMGCSLDGCKQRDLVVFSIAKQHDIPVQCSMGGGYSPDVSTIVQAHANTFLSAVEVFL